MANVNYQRGRRFEWEVKKDFETHGWVVLRTAGSHGAYDIIALNAAGELRLIQCKVTKDEKHIKRLKKEFIEGVPFETGTFTQLLAIKVKGKKDYILYNPEVDPNE